MRIGWIVVFVLAVATAQAQTPDTLGQRANLPQVLERVAPVLPDTSTVQGSVGLTVFVDTLGRPVRVRVNTPLRPDADSAAVRAVRQWRFSPAQNATGEAIGGMARVALVFTPRQPRPPLPDWAKGFESRPRLVFPVALGSLDARREWMTTEDGCREVGMPARRSGSNPEYPDQLRRAGREGQVLIATRLDERGRVVEAQVAEHDDPDFEEVSLRAVRSWRFSPATCDGQPVSSAMLIPVRFRTRGGTGIRGRF
ncbi:MAG: energy transducer TonB [Bacteroidetes bacterium]|nr:energy transducer TonB [Bacteroidota bacterium]